MYSRSFLYDFAVLTYITGAAIQQIRQEVGATEECGEGKRCPRVSETLLQRFSCKSWSDAVSRDTESPPEKTEKEIQSEIQSIFRQITASVTFLPQLDGHCTFNVLVYADADSEVPLEWGDSDAKEIKGAERVQLRSFSTSSHKVDTLVSYRLVHVSNIWIWKLT